MKKKTKEKLSVRLKIIQGFGCFMEKSKNKRLNKNAENEFRKEKHEDSSSSLKKLEIKRKKRKHKNLSIHGAIDIVNREKEVQSLVPPHISRSFIANYYMDKHVC